MKTMPISPLSQNASQLRVPTHLVAVVVGTDVSGPKVEATDRDVQEVVDKVVDLSKQVNDLEAKMGHARRDAQRTTAKVERMRQVRRVSAWVTTVFLTVAAVVALSWALPAQGTTDLSNSATIESITSSGSTDGETLERRSTFFRDLTSFQAFALSTPT